MDIQEQTHHEEGTELTPELEANILGEAPPEEEPEEEKEKSPDSEEPEDSKPDELPELPEKESEEKEEKPPEGEEEEPPEGEEKPSVEMFTKDQVEGFVKERLDKFGRGQKEEISQLREQLQNHSKKDEEAELPIEQQDLGEMFNEVAWKGLTVDSLREAGHTDHVSVALGRIAGIQEAERQSKLREEENTVQQRREVLLKQVEDLKDVDPSYHDKDGKPLEEPIKELARFADKQGVSTLADAHKLKNFDAIVDARVKDEVAKLVKEGKEVEPLERAKEVESTSDEKTPIEKMDDEQLQQAYVDSSDPETTAKLEKILEKKGLL